MRDLFSGGDAAGEFDEIYRLVAPQQYWSWIATWSGHPDFKEAGTAGLWTAQKWFFDGTVTQRPHPHDTETHRIRMIYTWISNTSIERELEIFQSGVWRITSSSVCRRTPASGYLRSALALVFGADGSDADDAAGLGFGER